MRPRQRHPVAEAILPRAFRSCFLAIFLLASGLGARADPKTLGSGKGEGGGEGPALRASVAVDSRGSASSTIRLEGGPGLALLGLAIDGDGAALRGAFRYGPLVCGPGRLAGPAGFLSAPLSSLAIPLGGASFKVDAGLASSLSLLALDLGGVAAFALCRDGGRGFIAGAGGLAAEAPACGSAGFSLAPQPIAGDSGCGTGLVARVKAGGGDLAFMAAASRSAPPGSDGPWRLGTAPDPGGLGLVAGLACEARGQDWRSTVGLGYSWGPLRGGGAAARFAGSAKLGAVRLSLQAGYADGRFRDCAGEKVDSGAALALACGLALWDGATLRASCRVECPSLAGTWPRGIALRDLVERSATVALSARAGGAGSGPEVLRLGSGLSFGIDGDGKAFLSPDLGLSGRTGAASFSVGLSGRWVQPPGEARASPSLRASLKAATAPSAPVSLEGGQCLSWEAGAAPVLDASLGFSFAARGGGRVSFAAEWRRLRLGVGGAGETAPAPGFTLRYSLSQ